MDALNGYGTYVAEVKDANGSITYELYSTPMMQSSEMIYSPHGKASVLVALNNGYVDDDGSSLTWCIKR